MGDEIFQDKLVQCYLRDLQEEFLECSYMFGYGNVEKLNFDQIKKLYSIMKNSELKNAKQYLEECLSKKEGNNA